MTAPVATATILSCFIGRVRNAVEQLNKRAKRLRVAPFELTVSDPWIRQRRKSGTAAGYREDLQPVIAEEVVDIVISGEPVKFSEWDFVAKIDFMGDAGVIISKAPGHESLVLERPDAQRCDHCRTARRRAVCYVVQNDTGARKVIGSSCLADFTGGSRSVEKLVSLGFDAISLLDGADGWGDEGGGSGSRALGIDDLLTVVAAMIRTYGWMSRGQGREQQKSASVDMAVGWIYAKPEMKRKCWPQLERLTRGDRAVALRSIHWAQQIVPSSDYEENISTLSRTHYTSARHEGLAASIVSAWLRHREKLVRRASAPKANPDAYAGTVGKREEFAVMIAGIRAIERDFGGCHRVAMIDVATGAELIWWASGDVPEAIMDAGAMRPVDAPVPIVKIAGRVKKHDTYNGRRQTTLQRVAIAKERAPKKPRAKKSKAAKSEPEVAHA